MTVFISNLRRV